MKFELTEAEWIKLAEFLETSEAPRHRLAFEATMHALPKGLSAGDYVRFATQLASELKGRSNLEVAADIRNNA